MYLNVERRCKSQQNLRNSCSSRIVDGKLTMRDATSGVTVQRRTCRHVFSGQIRRKSCKCVHCSLVIVNLISASANAVKSKSVLIVISDDI